MAEVETVSLTCKCGHKFRCKAPSSPGNYSVTCTNPECRTKVSFHYPLISKPLTLSCKECGKTFQCKAPSASGNYSVTCINPECRAKVSFRYPLASQQQDDHKKDVQLGLLEDGSYRFICKTEACHQTVLVPSLVLKVGHNKVKCPKCGTFHEFDIEPTENDLLHCKTDGCNGILKKPDGGDGNYASVCEECEQEYSIRIQGGKVVNVIMKTLPPPTPSRKFDLELVLSHFIVKKKYPLFKGTHYIGRYSDENKSDFEIKDKYASSRSIRIDVNENGGNLVYKLTVERAMNPVYHNGNELSVGDIVYLTFGDTIKLGKTLIKVQKIPK